MKWAPLITFLLISGFYFACQRYDVDAYEAGYYFGLYGIPSIIVCVFMFVIWKIFEWIQHHK